MDTIRDLNYTRLYYIALVIVPAGKGPIPHLTRLYPRACGRPRLRAARCARDALARLLYMARLEPSGHPIIIGHQVIGHQVIGPIIGHQVIGHQVIGPIIGHHREPTDEPNRTETQRQDKEKKTKDIDTGKEGPIMRTHQGN